MKNTLSLSYLGSAAALGVAACCVLPMALMLLGLGGSWISIFGSIAASGWYVPGVSTILVLAAWLIALRRHSAGRLKWWLAGSTAMTGFAWIVILNESGINDYLIMRM